MPRLAPCCPALAAQDGCTALLAAALSGHVGVARVLLEAGANTEAGTEVGGALVPKEGEGGSLSAGVHGGCGAKVHVRVHAWCMVHAAALQLAPAHCIGRIHAPFE